MACFGCHLEKVPKGWELGLPCLTRCRCSALRAMQCFACERGDDWWKVAHYVDLHGFPEPNIPSYSAAWWSIGNATEEDRSIERVVHPAPCMPFNAKRLHDGIPKVILLCCSLPRSVANQQKMEICICKVCCTCGLGWLLCYMGNQQALHLVPCRP